MSDEEKRWFRNPTDVKLSRDSKHLMVCASGGGVALISLEEKRSVWHRYAGGNAHSVAELPNGDLVVACSTPHLLVHIRIGTGGSEEAVEFELEHAHGVTWDEERKCLWALGSLHLHRFTQGEDGALHLAEVIALPVLEKKNHSTNGGHDLILHSSGQKLLLSDAWYLWEFFPEGKRFEKITELDRVKSMTEIGDQIAMVRATESWWSDEVRYLQGEERLRFDGARLYKVRWIELSNVEGR